MKREFRSLGEILESTDFTEPQELARALRVSTPTVYMWVRTGSIPYVKFGQLVRFNPKEIINWIESNRKNNQNQKNELNDHRVLSGVDLQEAGAILRFERLKQGLTVEGLAAKTGLNWTTISKIEGGGFLPKNKQLTLIADALKINIVPLLQINKGEKT